MQSPGAALGHPQLIVETGSVHQRTSLLQYFLAEAGGGLHGSIQRVQQGLVVWRSHRPLPHRIAHGTVADAGQWQQNL